MRQLSFTARMKRERPEDAEQSPNKVQKQENGAPAASAVADDSAPASQSRSKVRKGTECPYLDTIARQVVVLYTSRHSLPWHIAMRC